jgi:hypothetical protein
MNGDDEDSGFYLPPVEAPRILLAGHPVNLFVVLGRVFQSGFRHFEKFFIFGH